MAIATTASGARIGWDSFGNDTAPPLVLIQGLGAPRLGWRPGFCERLVAEGLRVIRMDNRDTGESQHYPKGGYALGDFADDCAALLDTLGLPSAHFAGQSMGGMVAQLLWQRHPQRVRSLGLIYTAVSLRHARGRAEIESRMARPVPRSREEFVPYYLAGEALCASPAYAQDTTWLASLGASIWDAGWDPAAAARHAMAALTAPDRSELARSIRVPTTIIAGEHDGLIDPAASRELHHLIPGSTLRIFPGMGHELPQPLWSELATLLAANTRAAEHAP